MGHATLLDGNADAQHCAGHVKTAAYTTLQADHLKVQSDTGGKAAISEVLYKRVYGHPIYEMYLQSDLPTIRFTDIRFIRSVDSFFIHPI